MPELSETDEWRERRSSITPLKLDHSYNGRSPLVKRPSILSNGTLTNSRRTSIINLGGSRRRSSYMKKPKVSYWAKINDEEHQKKLKMVSSILLKLGIFLCDVIYDFISLDICLNIMGAFGVRTYVNRY